LARTRRKSKANFLSLAISFTKIIASASKLIKESSQAALPRKRHSNVKKGG